MNEFLEGYLPDFGTWIQLVRGTTNSGKHSVGPAGSLFPQSEKVEERFRIFRVVAMLV